MTWILALLMLLFPGFDASQPGIEGELSQVLRADYSATQMSSFIQESRDRVCIAEPNRPGCPR